MQAQTAPVWRMGDKELDFKNGPFIMGILNVTPDSFSDGGRFYDTEDAVKHALEMEKQGADIIDIGGESTRPGAEPVSAEEELRRVLPVIRSLRKQSPVWISVDTSKSEVAAAALEAGADMINDISAARFDTHMPQVALRYDCPIIIMHMKGRPENMQDNPFYKNVTDEVRNFLQERLRVLQEYGIRKIIIDPGIGFGKRVADNLQLIKRLAELKELGQPVLMGLSRKSFIGKLLKIKVEERLSGTLAANLISVQNGADILRVHDVKETRQMLLMYKYITNNSDFDENHLLN